MGKQVLVAYATKYGATGEIAEKIRQVLQDAGLQADVSLVKEAPNVSAYDAVVLGSAVYMGGWRKEAVKFLKDNETALEELPVWIFSSGPAGEGDPVELLDGWRLPEKLQPIADRIQPRDIAVFHGKVDIEKVSRLEKYMINTVKSPVGDFRDWEAITVWAQAIVDEIINE